VARCFADDKCGRKFDAVAPRAVATRYDKLAARFEATVHIALINEWLLRTSENGT